MFGTRTEVMKALTAEHQKPQGQMPDRPRPIDNAGHNRADNDRRQP
ncbi:MAG: hypothetical protein HC779_08295 [Phyllobacteriaceae bacterium]|nr:hypothetical protein [Phyllobacteriaceae bacterium]